MDQITFRCAHCGSTSFSGPYDPEPDDQIICDGCAASASYGELHARMLRQCERILADVIRQALNQKRMRKLPHLGPQ